MGIDDMCTECFNDLDSCECEDDTACVDCGEPQDDHCADCGECECACDEDDEDDGEDEDVSDEDATYLRELYADIASNPL